MRNEWTEKIEYLESSLAACRDTCRQRGELIEELNAENAKMKQIIILDGGTDGIAMRHPNMEG